VSDAVTLILPGLGDSGPDHWQTRWERRDASFRRVMQDEWEAPRCADWIRRLGDTIASTRDSIVLVGHSTGCALVAHWADHARFTRLQQVRGALLVAPSDPEGPHYPAGPEGFAPMPLRPLPFRSIVVSSTNDPYVSDTRAREYAAAWGSEFVSIGAAGHINAASGLGDWEAGLELLRSLRDGPSGSASAAH
jgi:predicted alpha/beta hydrolase family esterase